MDSTKPELYSEICAKLGEICNMRNLDIRIWRYCFSSLMTAATLLQYDYRLLQSPSWNNFVTVRSPKMCLIAQKRVQFQLSVSKLHHILQCQF